MVTSSMEWRKVQARNGKEELEGRNENTKNQHEKEPAKMTKMRNVKGMSTTNEQKWGGMRTGGGEREMRWGNRKRQQEKECK